MNENTYDKIKIFVSQKCAVSIQELSPQTQLTKDMGLDGDDAVDFMEAFSKEFDVDLSEFEFSKHFGPEAGFNPFVYLYYLLSAKFKPQYIPITLYDLQEAINKKKWLSLKLGTQRR